MRMLLTTVAECQTELHQATGGMVDQCIDGISTGAY